MTLQDFFSYSSNVLLLLNVILYFKGFLKNKKALIFFWAYLLIMLIIEIISIRLYLKREPNLFLSHYYFIAQFICLSFFYLNLFLKKRNSIKYITIFIAFSLLLRYIIWPSLFDKFNLFEIVLTSLILIIYSLFYLFINLKKDIEYSYINIGVLVYILSSMLIFCSGNLMSELSYDVNRYLWTVNSMLSVIFQLLIFYEWYKNLRFSKEVLKIE